jgi:hypothetical protein
MVVLRFAQAENAAWSGHWLAAYRAARLVASTRPLWVKKKWPPATTATIIRKKKAAVTANSTTATPLCDFLLL